MDRCLRGFLVVASILLLTSSVASAQATAGLAGRVTDESGGVLPGVTVTATQTDTGFTRPAVTDGSGAWVMSNLPVGPYRLEIALQGFRTFVQTGIVLQVGATPTINAALAVGNLEETVTIEANAPLVDVRGAGISEVVEEERIVELPLQGREMTDLIVLSGAAYVTGRPNTKNFQGGVSIAVAGGMDAGVAYFLDGAMHNDVQNAGGLPLPFPDAMQEFRVATSGLSAQNGMHSGASINAVTKSGTNAFHGNAFEFLRDRRFNATHPFAATGPDGKRVDDGLRRNQFGGTLGGPIARDRMFFFGGYQGTATRVASTSNIAYVPTAAMLAGDFTAFASPACNSGRQIALRAPFVNNRISPAQFSPAALNITARLPTTEDPCGETRFAQPDHKDEGQVVTRLDYQVSGDQSVFGRYMLTFHKAPSSFSLAEGNILATHVPAVNNYAQAMTLGHTAVIGSGTVNNLRFAYNRTTVDRSNADYFGPQEVGINIFNHSPTRELQLAVTGGFEISDARASKGLAENNAYQMSNDLTMVRGRHEIGVGATVAFWKVFMNTWSRSGGNYAFNGQITGLGLADFMLGRVSVFSHNSYVGVTFNHWYQGLYIQDAWRATDRLTVNAGVRWEPFSGQHLTQGSVTNFDEEKFRQGIKSTMFVNAPAGFMYPGDPGFPSGRSGFEKKWMNFAPRAGIAWDVRGNGRMGVRASYGLAYDFPEGETWFNLASGAPYGSRLMFQDPPGRLDDPYAHVGGDPGPSATSKDSRFPPFGEMGSIDPDINSPRVQQWNVSLEQQFGSSWAGSVSYIGSYSDRLWGSVELNQGAYLGSGPCTINGVAYPVCTAPANLNNRRVLYLQNPAEAQYIGNAYRFDDLSTQNYRGLKLSLQRRSVNGISLNGNWTWGRCVGLQLGRGGGGGSGSGGGGPYAKVDDLEYDRGHCDWDRTHLANLTLGYQSPEFSAPLLRVLASDWRLSGIVSARSGDWLTVTTGVTHFTGTATANRVDQVSDDVYGEKTMLAYLNRAAFAVPAPGTFGDHERNSITGPGFWKADLAVSRLFPFGGTQQLEVRAEVFNLLNNFNWGNPATNLNGGNFGRIQTMVGDPRIMQFVLKYGF
jgi:hypothetical protein